VAGAALLAGGFILWMLFLGASAFRSGFGGEPLPVFLFVIPALMLLGGPIVMWFILPRRRKARAKRGER
jgi:hypothetical protein